MAPGMRPTQPMLGFAVAAENRQPEQVVEAAAIDANHHGLRALEHVCKVERWQCLLFPMLSTGPAIAAQRYADLDIEVLRRQQHLIGLALALGVDQLSAQKVNVDRTAEIR